MKKIIPGIILTLLVSLVFSQNSAHAGSQIHEVVLKKYMHAAQYTYLNVVENESETWLAVPKMEAVVGKTYYYMGGFEMRNFKSAELDTVFYSIYFLNGVLDEKAIEPKAEEESKMEVSVIEPLEGGISIAELLSKADDYADKSVKLKGRVVKFSGGIMGLNWIHLDDGSAPDGESDLTITSDDTATVGDVIVVEGTIVLNKDFGSGYFYKVIMEKGEIVK